MNSFFGSTLHTADINNDGLDDLLVGAPMYSPRSVTGPGYDQEIGLVVLYLGSANVSIISSITKHGHYLTTRRIQAREICYDSPNTNPGHILRLVANKPGKYFTTHRKQARVIFYNSSNTNLGHILRLAEYKS